MVKAKINPTQSATNGFSIHAKDACCNDSTPDSATYEADFSGAVTGITSASFTFKRNAAASNETITIDNFPHTVTSMRNEIVDQLKAAGFNIQNKADVTVSGTTVTIIGELIPQTLTDNAGSDAFVAS